MGGCRGGPEPGGPGRAMSYGNVSSRKRLFAMVSPCKLGCYNEPRVESLVQSRPLLRPRFCDADAPLPDDL